MLGAPHRLASISLGLGLLALGVACSSSDGPATSNAVGGGAGSSASLGGGGATNGGGAGPASGGSLGVAGDNARAGSSTGGAPTAMGGTNAGGAAGSSAGNGNAAGNASSAGSAGSGLDTPAPREIAADKGMHHQSFTPKSVDAMANQGHATATEIGAFDGSKPLQKKLCVILTDVNTGPGGPIADWLVGHGFHVFQVAYQNDLALAPDGDTSANVPGDTRMDQFDGKGRVTWAKVARADSIEGRTVAALTHLKAVDTGADWGWFLNADGSVRWSDAILVGYGYGGTHAAIIAHSVRLGRVVSTAGPDSVGHTNATWLTPSGATPNERLFALFGASDNPAVPGGYESTTAALGYLGTVLKTGLNDAPVAANPYGGSHRLEIDGGKTVYCAPGADRPPCLYAFGLPL